MKKALVLATMLALTAASSRADLMWYESFNYPNGCIETNSGGLWICHSPTTPAKDALVLNGMLQNGSTSATLYPTRQDDIHRLFPAAYTNSGPIPVFASFTIIATNIPSAAGGYVAHFTDNTSSDFFARLYAFQGTNLVGATNLWRLGIAATAAAPNKIFPVDLALNTPYQVVVEYDTGNLDAVLWVNPLSSSDTSVATSDTVSSSLQTKVMQTYAFRQASGMSNWMGLITNLATATSFDEAATNVWSRTPVAPTIAVQPVGFSGFVGVSNALSAVANGQSLANLTYQWQLNGTNISNPAGNSGVLSFPSPQISDSGPYTVVVTSPLNLSVTSAVANVSVTFAPVPPTISQQPVSTKVYPDQNASFSIAATGPGPITFQWCFGGTDAGHYLVGETGNTLGITDVSTNNGNIGNYACLAINQYGSTTSSIVTLSITNPLALSVGALRSLVDSTFFLPTNLTAYYTVTGTVVNKTNMAVGNYEAAISDGTAGVSVYCYGGLTNEPNLGDVIQVTGPVGIYNSIEEFDIYQGTDPSTKVQILSTGNPAPLPVVLPMSFTNSASYGGVSNALHRYESTLVMLTNVVIPLGIGGTNVFASQSYTIQDGSGSLIWYVYYGITNIIGTPVPGFAYSLTGVMSEFEGNTVADRSSGYEFWVTDISDIVTNPPPAPVLSASYVGTTATISWMAVPYHYSYSVYSATSVTGPYLPASTGIVFPTTAGSYSETIGAGAKFYKVTSP